MQRGIPDFDSVVKICKESILSNNMETLAKHLKYLEWYYMKREIYLVKSTDEINSIKELLQTAIQQENTQAVETILNLCGGGARLELFSVNSDARKLILSRLLSTEVSKHKSSKLQVEFFTCISTINNPDAYFDIFRSNNNNFLTDAFLRPKSSVFLPLLKKIMSWCIVDEIFFLVEFIQLPKQFPYCIDAFKIVLTDMIQQLVDGKIKKENCDFIEKYIIPTPLLREIFFENYNNDKIYGHDTKKYEYFFHNKYFLSYLAESDATFNACDYSCSKANEKMLFEVHYLKNLIVNDKSSKFQLFNNDSVSTKICSMVARIDIEVEYQCDHYYSSSLSVLARILRELIETRNEIAALDKKSSSSAIVNELDKIIYNSIEKIKDFHILQVSQGDNKLDLVVDNRNFELYSYVIHNQVERFFKDRDYKPKLSDVKKRI